MKQAFEKILERLIIIRDKYSKDTTYGKNHISAYNKALKIVQEVAEEYNDGWIPCSGCKDCKSKEFEHYGKIY